MNRMSSTSSHGWMVREATPKTVRFSKHCSMQGNAMANSLVMTGFPVHDRHLVASLSCQGQTRRVISSLLLTSFWVSCGGSMRNQAMTFKHSALAYA